MNNSKVFPQPRSSRRHFLKASAALVATGTLAPYASLRGQTFTPNSDTLKVGLVGCGGRGTGAAGQALRADSNAMLTAVADVFATQCAQSLSALQGEREINARVRVEPDRVFTGLDGYKKLLASGVDVVVLAAPPGFRPMHVRAAVEAGKHIFCEKPVATDAPGIRSVLESAQMAKQKKLAWTAGFCWRYDLPRREFFKRVHGGAIGDIRSIYATYYTSPVKPMPSPDQRPAGMGDVEWQVRNWYNFVWLCGDGLVEQAVHSVDKIMWAMKDVPPVKAVAVGGRQIPNHQGNIYDHIFVAYEFPNEARAFMGQRQTSNCFNQNSDFLMGTKGLANIHGQGPIIKGDETWRYQGTRNDMYQTEHDELFASIRAGKPIHDGEWMTHSTLAAIMGRMAAYTGQEVTWEQALKSEERLVPEPLDWNMPLPIAPMAMPGANKLA